MDIGAFDSIAIILIVVGILNLFGVMVPYAATMRRKYTLESMKRWIRPCGVATVIMGVGCELTDISSFSKNSASVHGWVLPLGIGAMVVGAILGLVFNKIFLEKIR